MSDKIFDGMSNPRARFGQRRQVLSSAMCAGLVNLSMPEGPTARHASLPSRRAAKYRRGPQGGRLVLPIDAPFPDIDPAGTPEPI